MSKLCRWAVLILLLAQGWQGYAENIEELGQNFWVWRAQEQPFTADDIPRIERPAGFVVDWSPKTVNMRMEELAGFEQRWNKLAPSADAPIPQRVDYRLIGSALARAMGTGDRTGVEAQS